jgi:uncharacterized membrane protein
MNKSRLEAFSDAIFGFAATLLILGIALPEFKNTAPSDAELARALVRLWPQLLAYLMSFAVIGIMWQNHHALFRLIVKVDRMTIFLNLALLAVAAFIPFATSTLGTYPDMRSTTFLYGLTLTGSATAYNLMLMHLVRSGAFAAHVSTSTIRGTVIAYKVGWVTYAIAMLASLVAPIVGFALYLLVVAYYLIPHGADTDIAGASREN